MAKSTPEPAAEPLAQSVLSQAEILVLLDWLDKLVEVAERTGREPVAATINASYESIERTFRTVK